MQLTVHDQSRAILTCWEASKLLGRLYGAQMFFGLLRIFYDAGLNEGKEKQGETKQQYNPF